MFYMWWKAPSKMSKILHISREEGGITANHHSFTFCNLIRVEMDLQPIPGT